MLGVAAITSVAYALSAAFDSSDSEDEELDADSRIALNNFQRFGAEYFLTDFSSERSFDRIKDNKMTKNKKSKTMKRRSSNYRRKRSGHQLRWRSRNPRHLKN